jgi:hypothetical protein
VLRSNPEAAKTLLKQARDNVATRWHMYQYLAARNPAEEPEMPDHRGYQVGHGVTHLVAPLRPPPAVMATLQRTVRHRM